MEDQQVIQQWLDYAQKLAARGRLDEAIQALLIVTKEAPQNLPVRTALIELALQKKDYQTTVAQHMDCIELLWLAGDKGAALERCETLLRLEELVQLRPHCTPEEVLEVRRCVDQVRPILYCHIGEHQLDQQKVEVALQYLRKARELAPGVWETHLALGRAYMAKEAYKDAIGELQEVLRLTQTDQYAAQAQAYQMLGEVFVLQRRPPMATITWFERAAQLWVQQERLEEACQAYQRVVDLDPTNKAVLESLGDLYTRLQFNDQAFGVYSLLSGVLDREGSHDQVVRLRENLRQLQPRGETPPPPDLQVKGHFPAEEPQVVRIFKRQPK